MKILEVKMITQVQGHYLQLLLEQLLPWEISLGDQALAPKKNKAKSDNDDYKKNETKIQEGVLQVQKDRQADFRMYVSNQAKQQAFKMAVLGYNTFKDDDSAEAAKYKETMNNIIIRNNTLADSEGDMPPLGGNNEAV